MTTLFRHLDGEKKSKLTVEGKLIPGLVSLLSSRINHVVRKGPTNLTLLLEDSFTAIVWEQNAEVFLYRLDLINIERSPSGAGDAGSARR